MTSSDWKPTACILCSENCGIEIQVEGRRFAHIKGDRAHPSSQGYLCDKPAHLDHYQNNSERLTTPLRRNEAGGFELVSWETAIAEIGARTVRLRDTYGPYSLAFYGCAAQGNQLALPWAIGFRMAIGTPYLYHALGQEKTGDFWLDGKIFGNQTCHTSRDMDNADFVIFIGTNPWHSHGFPRARKLLHDLSGDPARTMVVVDPRRTETAGLADLFLQIRPGTDAYFLAALIATILQDGLEDRAFIETRTTGFEEVRRRLMEVPVDRYASLAGLDPAAVRQVARGFATTPAAIIRSDLGLEQSLHSTLNLYFEKLLYLITGHFGRKGSHGIHAQTVPLIWHNDPDAPGFDAMRTRVAGMMPIGGFYPPNILPGEIDSDHPERVRGLFVDSANPAVTGADAQAYRRAFGRLDLLVVIDKDMTETAEYADFVLPACTQYERFECTFFNWGWPVNHLHLRHPVLPRTGGTLSEQEIYRRLAVAIGADFSKNPLLGPLMQLSEAPPMQAFPPEMRIAAAPLLFASMQFAAQHEQAVLRAGVVDEGQGLAAALFTRIMTSPSGAVISRHEYEDAFSFVKHADGRIHLAVPELFPWIEELEAEAAAGGVRRDPDYPFVLSAGERRASNATTIYRDPKWRRVDPAGALRMNPDDAARLGIADGDPVQCESRAGRIVVTAQIDDTVQPGAATLPHGFGLKYTSADGVRVPHGPLINQLTSSDHCDPLTKTPFHKNIPVRLQRADAALGS